MNYHELSAEKKAVLKPLIEAVRKQLYEANNVATLKDGITINFGKRQEARHVVTIKAV